MAEQEQQRLVVFDFNGTLDAGHGLYKGVPQMLKALHQKGHVLAIVSMAERRTILRILEAESEKAYPDGSVLLPDLFESVVGIDEIRQANHGVADKTNPKVLHALVEDLNLQGVETGPEKAVIVGDAFSEQLLAKRTNSHFIYAGWHDVLNELPVKSGLSVVEPCDENGFVGLSAGDISEAISAETVPGLCLKIKALQREPQLAGQNTFIDLER